MASLFGHPVYTAQEVCFLLGAQLSSLDHSKCLKVMLTSQRRCDEVVTSCDFLFIYRPRPLTITTEIVFLVANFRQYVTTEQNGCKSTDDF